MKLSPLFLLVLCVNAAAAPETDKKEEGADFEQSIRLLDSEMIIQVGAKFDVKTHAAELNKLLDAGAESLKETVKAKDQEIACRFTFYPDKDYEIEVFGRPEIEESAIDEIVEAFRAVEVSRSHLIPIRLQLNYLRGTPPAVPADTIWPPGSEPGHVVRAAEFSKLEAGEKVKYLRQWSREFALPILGAYQRRADPQFKGVTGMGELLGKLDLSEPFDIPKLINSNDDYWRGMLEMSQGNPLICGTRIFMEAANGNLAQAVRFAELHRSFLDDKALPAQMLFEFINLHEQLRKEINPRIQAAIDDFDRGKYKGAIEKCEAVLKDHPRHPWATYELWFSKHTQAILSKEEGPPWREAAPLIYSMDSLYPICAEGRTDQEIFEMICRLSLKELKPPTTREEFIDVLVKQADLALDLDVFPYAAEAYWLIMGFFPKEAYGDRELFNFTVYSIHRAGAEGISKLMKGGWEEISKAPAAFKKERRESTLKPSEEDETEESQEDPEN